MRSIIITLLVSISLVGCSSFGSDKSTRSQSNKTASALYQEASEQLSRKSYESALKTLATLEAQYPFTPEAIQGQLDAIYAHYESGNTNDVINTAQRFISRNAQHPKADYAYYMIGLARFNQGKGAFERYLSVDLSKRDLGIAKSSFNDFALLLRAYPNSTYAADAQQRMVYLRNIMARHEINVANYYFQRGAYLAAANRGLYVVENFPNTPAVADALAVMTQGYTLLNMDQHANDALLLLRKNYPDYPYLNEDGSFKLQLTEDQKDASLINKLSLGIFDTPKAPVFDTRQASEK